jgi:hypothetical protein
MNGEPAVATRTRLAGLRNTLPAADSVAGWAFAAALLLLTGCPYVCDRARELCPIGALADGGADFMPSDGGGLFAEPGDLLELGVRTIGDGTVLVHWQRAGAKPFDYFCPYDCDFSIPRDPGLITLTPMVANGVGAQLFKAESDLNCSISPTPFSLVPSTDRFIEPITICTIAFGHLHQLTVTMIGSGKDQGSVSSPLGMQCTGYVCTASFVDNGDVVHLDEFAQPGTVRFVGWGGDCAGTDTDFEISKIDRDWNCTAEFALIDFLSVTVTGPGKVLSNPAGIDCGATCGASFDDGSMVTLTATPRDSSVGFAGWGGDCSGADNPLSVTMTPFLKCTATFGALHTLTVKTPLGKVQGTVTCSDSECSTTVAEHQQITLTMTADTGYAFTEWSTGCAPSFIYTATTDFFCIATFEPAQQTVTVTRSGGGQGKVGSTPIGIECGATCSAAFVYGATVTLTATPSPGSYFAGWSGDCSGTGTATLTIAQSNLACTARFEPQPRLTVTRIGAGTGTVTSDQTGINCGTACDAGFDPATMVTLTATADVGSYFAGWSGDCHGTGTATVTLPYTNLSCTADFELEPQLTVTKNGFGVGTVTSSPAGIDCGTACDAADAGFDPGTTVTLSETADPGSSSSFAGWGGACSDAGTVTMPTMDQTCTATFNAPCGAIQLTQNGATLYLKETIKTAGNGNYYWYFSWLTSQPPGEDYSTSIAAPTTPGTYTISVFLVGSAFECGPHTTYTVN